MALMTMECLSCGTLSLLDCSPTLLSEIGTAGEAWMHCNSCNRETNWIFADLGRRSGADRRRNEESPAPQATIQRERRSFNDRREILLRQNERVPVSLPIFIRYENRDARFEEITETVNVSRRGICFKSSHSYAPGATAYVTLNYSPKNPGANIEKLGSVLRVDPPASPSDFSRVAMRLS